MRVPSPIFVLAALLLASGFAQAQFTKVTPQPVQKIPLLKPVANPAGMSVRDRVEVRRYYPTLQGQFQNQFEPYAFLSWKGADGNMQFNIAHVGAAYPNAKLRVYAFQQPAEVQASFTPINQLTASSAT